MKTERVEGCDLREGDVVVRQVEKSGALISVWGKTPVKMKNGVLGWVDFGFEKEPRFSSGYWFEVATPRPPEPINEFGIVSP